jgi:hypothetical protein
MNAYKLADELEGFGYLNSDDGLHFCPFQAQVDMLRQQQAEIERLIGAEPITYGMLTVCKNCGQQNPYFEKAQEK